jgi:hypothetical protein
VQGRYKRQRFVYKVQIKTYLWQIKTILKQHSGNANYFPVKQTVMMNISGLIITYNEEKHTGSA